MTWRTGGGSVVDVDVVVVGGSVVAVVTVLVGAVSAMGAALDGFVQAAPSARTTNNQRRITQQRVPKIRCPTGRARVHRSDAEQARSSRRDGRDGDRARRPRQ